MTKQEYETRGTLTAKQVQARKDYYKKYNSTRRKFNIIGGIICGIAVYKLTPLLHIDLAQPLSDSDIMKIVISYGALLLALRLARQQIQKAFTPTDYYDIEVQKAAEQLTPEQAAQIIKEDAERMTAAKTDTNRANSLFIIITAAAVIGAYFLFKGGVLQ